MVLALACFGSALPLQANELRVGISGSAPFVIQDGDSTSGISLDIWRRVAEDNNYSYELIPQPSSKPGLQRWMMMRSTQFTFHYPICFMWNGQKRR